MKNPAVTGLEPNRSAARPIHVIAAEIRTLWPNVHYTAKPYLDAMSALTSIEDAFGADPAADVILRFLSNAWAWKGTDARRIKAELKSLVTPSRR